MFSSHSTTKISNEQVNRVVSKILNKRQRTLREQQQTFIRRDSDEKKKRDNYLVDKFTVKKQTTSSKENEAIPVAKLVSPKKKAPVVYLDEEDDEDDDFVSIKKRKKIPKPKPIEPIPKKKDPVKECLESMISQIENEDARCPICNEILSTLTTLDQREQHVNRCLEATQMNQIESKQQKSILSYSNFSSTTDATTSRKANIISTSSTHFKCQICGTKFNVKRTYLSHLKKCSTQNSVQLKHVINFAAKTVEATEKVEESKETTTTSTKKSSAPTIKNRVLKLEIPRTEDDEQQQLAIALSASLKTIEEPPPNAFEILQTAAKKVKTIDLFKTPLWNVSPEERIKLSSTRVSNLCERLIIIDSLTEPYQFPLSPLFTQSQLQFGHVDWWKISTTDPQDDELPMTQLARILHDEDEESSE